MIQSRTTPDLRRRALGMALCYALALQAFLAAYTGALAASPASELTVGFVICHNAASDGPADRDTQTPVSVPCALCALATSASALLPPPLFAVVPPSTVAGRVRHGETAVVVGSRPMRAGLARAPPNFA
jgi:hypothetical protein